MTEAPTGYITREYFDLIINSLQKQASGALNVIVSGYFSPDLASGATDTFNSGDFANVLSTDKVVVTGKSLFAATAIKQAVASNGSVAVTFSATQANLADVICFLVWR